MSTAGRGPRGRPHPTGRQDILSQLRHSLHTGRQEILLHLRRSQLADGHKGRTLQWIFEDIHLILGHEHLFKEANNSRAKQTWGYILDPRNGTKITSTAYYTNLSNLQGAALVAVRILRANKKSILHSQLADGP